MHPKVIACNYFSYIVSDEVAKVAEFPDLRQILVLSKTDWSRIQDEMNHVDKEKERVIEEAKEREALHLQSVEVVKQWSDTFAVSYPSRNIPFSFFLLVISPG